MPLTHGVQLALLFALVALASRGPGGQPSSWPLRIGIVPSPSPLGSAQPQLSESTAGVLLSWIEQNGSRATLRFAARTSAGWTEPRAVAAGNDWFVNWADVPSVVRLDDGTLAAHWLQKSGPDTYAYDVRLARSHDEGRTWSAPFGPHHDGTKTEHGFVTLFQAPDAGLGLVWLDGRAMSADDAGPAGAMSLRFAAYDSNWSQTSDTAVDTRVCECCPTSAVVTDEGVVTAFRNRGEDEVRDIHVSRLSGGGWSEPVPVHRDGWRIPACPVNGPMLAARGHTVAIAWFTARDDVGHAYVAFSADAGRSFGPPIRLDDVSALGRVDIVLLDDGTAAASWMEFAGEQAHFAVRRVDPSGSRSKAITVAAVEGRRASGYPRLARHGDELLFAWTEFRDGRSVVSTAIARVPPAGR